ncbi:S9 family peptidase [Bowmanella dokdonensis]|uniref:S9 family peptidase n=1 Tax=Bowmanella dokdonensis TaxID=751969 RepID=A0A939DNR1_9ALTE|nr:S9 family peptidase [Bowmanella dokdonensis]MBN7825146.1 S9 family peptidase [Bowmanella dokdonensis]
MTIHKLTCRLSIPFLCAMLSLSLSAIADTKPFVMDDLYRLKDVAEPQFSADGNWLLYSVTHANREQDSYQSDLYLASWDGKERKQLTATPEASEFLPRWLPDGQSIAYLSDQTDDETTQLFIRSLDGSQVRQVSRWPLGISDFVLSPDGRRAAFIAEEGTAREKGKTAPPIEIDRFQFKEDYRGYLTARQHLYLLEMDSGKSQLLTPGEHDDYLPSWSPDGKWIAFVSKRGEEADRDLNFDIYLVSPDSGQQRQLSTYPGTDVDPYWESRPAWSADSSRLAWLRSGLGKWIYYTPWQLVVADVQSGRQWQPVQVDRSFYKPGWGSDGKLYALLEQSRNTWLVRVDVDKDSLEYLNQGQRFGYDFALSENGRIALLESHDSQPFALVALEAGRARMLADHNEFLQRRQLQRAEDIQFLSADGTEVQGLLVRPVGYEKGRRYPLIVRLHGGPVYQFSHEFMWDWQLYSQAGYTVLAVNPRGSSGRGFDYAKAIYANWGALDTQDVLAGVDYLVEQGIADPKRLGVGGWSYGSILTNYVIASDQRFKAAVSGAGTSNILGNYGHDQYSREYELELGTPWQNLDAYLRVSFPFLQAYRIRTPTLFQCAALDDNVPCLGAEQMYQALRSLRIPTKLVVYPDQHHGLAVPSYVEHRMRQTLDWYDLYLRKNPDTASRTP